MAKFKIISRTGFVFLIFFAVFDKGPKLMFVMVTPTLKKKLTQTQSPQFPNTLTDRFFLVLSVKRQSRILSWKLRELSLVQHLIIVNTISLIWPRFFFFQKRIIRKFIHVINKWIVKYFHYDLTKVSKIIELVFNWFIGDI